MQGWRKAIMTALAKIKIFWENIFMQAKVAITYVHTYGE